MAAVDPAIEELLQRIGRQLLLTFGDDSGGRLLLYADAADGTSSPAIFGKSGGGTTVQMRFAPEELVDLVYTCWGEWREQPNHREWRVMAYLVDGDDLTIELIYPDQISDPADLDDPAFRQRKVEKYFPGERIDFTAS